MFDALNNGCVLRGGEGLLGGGCDVGGDVRLVGVCCGDVCLSGVGDVCVVIGGVMGFGGGVVSMSAYAVVSVSVVVVVGMVLLCFVVCEVILVCPVLCWLVSVVLLVELCCCLCVWVCCQTVVRV